MKINLIIDGNYILQRNVFSLVKHNLLYGGLEKSLTTSIQTYRRWFNFDKIYIVSDSKEKSWRKDIYSEYKGNRKKDLNIDWDFVYSTYNSFKESIKSNLIKVLEESKIEGDDWISYLTNTSNKKGFSNIIVSNDYDIKQLIKFGSNPNFINLMCNEIYNSQKIFLPKNYKIYIRDLKIEIMKDDIFNLSNNSEFLSLFSSFLERYEIIEECPEESYFIKLISGDSSDNIKSVLKIKTTSNKERGIGKEGAKSLYQAYITEFGSLDLNDVDLHNNICDIICEKKKLLKKDYEEMIINNLIINEKLINLNKLPNSINKKMEELINNI